MNPGIKQTFLILWIVTLGCVLSTTQALAQEHHHMGHTPAEMNMQFQKPDLDVNEFIRRFETDSREIYAQRRQIVATLGVRPGMAVADIGAGTGLFTWLIAEKVGTKGTVHAVEVAPAFLKYISEQAQQRGLEKVVKPVLGAQEATNLAPASIDLAFVCATYHHFEHPKKILSSIHQALRPGGRLVLVDFDLRKDSSDFVRERARAPERGLLPRDRGSGLWTRRGGGYTRPEGELLRRLPTRRRGRQFVRSHRQGLTADPQHYLDGIRQRRPLSEDVAVERRFHCPIAVSQPGQPPLILVRTPKSHAKVLPEFKDGLGVELGRRAQLLKSCYCRAGVQRQPAKTIPPSSQVLLVSPLHEGPIRFEHGCDQSPVVPTQKIEQLPERRIVE